MPSFLGEGGLWKRSLRLGKARKSSDLGLLLELLLPFFPKEDANCDERGLAAAETVVVVYDNSNLNGLVYTPGRHREINPFEDCNIMPFGTDVRNVEPAEAIRSKPKIILL